MTAAPYAPAPVPFPLTKVGLPGDLVAGLSVALVLIPQSLAYAVIAGVPAHVGLFAAALPPLVAAPFGSSPYLQTGPVALTALLTSGALSGAADVGSAEYVGLASLLAFIVGATRLLLGLFKLGRINELMTAPVVLGFTTGAAILIFSSQIPSMLGLDRDTRGVLDGAFWAITSPGDWKLEALAISGLTIAIVVLSRRIHALMPGVLIAVFVFTAWSALVDYDGLVVGELPGGWITLNLDLPWSQLTTLLFAGVVIALVGFAEPASISRTFSTEDRIMWNPNRELVGSGLANLASAASGAFPVGGSFSRSAVGRLAGATSRRAGAVTGLILVAAIPFAGVLETLPTAVLGAIVFTAVVSLITLGKIWALRAAEPASFVVAAGTFVATLATAPRVERGVVIGIALAGLALLLKNRRRPNP